MKQVFKLFLIPFLFFQNICAQGFPENPLKLSGTDVQKVLESMSEQELNILMKKYPELEKVLQQVVKQRICINQEVVGVCILIPTFVIAFGIVMISIAAKEWKKKRQNLRIVPEIEIDDVPPLEAVDYGELFESPLNP